ncbi:hypothetical protein KZA79_008250 [Streptococcus mitis]|jgi:hypothetical protein|uniref:hypothetical protein n=1 Tax=Streptococcus mitis TaxID=28037 RepID=UPI00050E09CB|nr:hypothetical protein [Streptococcus mitis]KGF33724.1 hypothetical protein HMPREF2134_06725 [Peptoniphilus lacrimalis DNF00528]MBW3454843.1 hypothetical protein [Streptococcus mitis]
MNTKIRSRTAFPKILEETLYQAYREGKRSVDFLLLFPVLEEEQEQIIEQVKSHSVVLDAKWRFGTVLFTAYIRH